MLHSLSRRWQKAVPCRDALAAETVDVRRGGEPWSGHAALVARVRSNLPRLSRHKAGELQRAVPRLPLHLHDPHSAFLPHGAHD